VLLFGGGGATCSSSGAAGMERGVSGGYLGFAAAIARNRERSSARGRGSIRSFTKCQYSVAHLLVGCATELENFVAHPTSRCATEFISFFLIILVITPSVSMNKAYIFSKNSKNMKFDQIFI
jgi:hypothetical protein